MSPNRAVLVGLGTGLITTGASTYYNRALAKGGDPGPVRRPPPSPSSALRLLCWLRRCLRS